MPTIPRMELPSTRDPSGERAAWCRIRHLATELWRNLATNASNCDACSVGGSARACAIHSGNPPWRSPPAAVMTRSLSGTDVPPASVHAMARRSIDREGREPDAVPRPTGHGDRPHRAAGPLGGRKSAPTPVASSGIRRPSQVPRCQPARRMSGNSGVEEVKPI